MIPPARYTPVEEPPIFGAMSPPLHIGWTDDHHVRILDQRHLPGEERYRVLTSVDEVAEAIQSLAVRGAPLIGVVAAMGMVLATGGGDAREVSAAAERLRATRPTAVNLGWALDRMLARAAQAGGQGLRQALIDEADAIWEEDQAMCRRIGEAGASLLADGVTVMTQCNAGALATGGIGTALAPVYLAAERGRRVEVLVPETRPLLQGSRLTAWELARAGIACTVITDNMVASRLAQGGVSSVIIGADRIAANGDVANKIGSYAIALAARAHDVPYYVAAPRSTFDPACPDGAAIPIEQRGADEVSMIRGVQLAPPGVAVWNPAFDVTPAAFVCGYITDAGLLTRDQLREWRDRGKD